jgi:hypothetical protein
MGYMQAIKVPKYVYIPHFMVLIDTDLHWILHDSRVD